MSADLRPEDLRAAADCAEGLLPGNSGTWRIQGRAEGEYGGLSDTLARLQRGESVRTCPALAAAVSRYGVPTETQAWAAYDELISLTCGDAGYEDACEYCHLVVHYPQELATRLRTAAADLEQWV